MKQEKKSNIEEELEWLESRLAQIKEDIDSQKYGDIEDRIIDLRDSKGGTSQKVAATAEQQKKAVRDSLKEYTALVGEVDKLREIEKQKQKGRGSAVINDRMRDLMSGG